MMIFPVNGIDAIDSSIVNGSTVDFPAPGGAVTTTLPPVSR